MIKSRRRVVLTLDSSDAAIILKSDGTCEISWPEEAEQTIPENVITSAALLYALQDDTLCDLIHENFSKECARFNALEKASLLKVVTERAS